MVYPFSRCSCGVPFQDFFNFLLGVLGRCRCFRRCSSGVLFQEVSHVRIVFELYPFRRCSWGVPFQGVHGWCTLSGGVFAVEPVRKFLRCILLEGVFVVHPFGKCS